MGRYVGASCKWPMFGNWPNFHIDSKGSNTHAKFLQLSWDLLRVVSFCGAAEQEDMDDDDDDDDNDDYYDDEDDGFSIKAREGIYEHNAAQVHQWAAEIK